MKSRPARCVELLGNHTVATALHGIHMLVGIGLLTTLALLMRRAVILTRT